MALLRKGVGTPEKSTELSLSDREKAFAGAGPSAYLASHRRDKYLHPWPEPRRLLEVT